MRPPGENTKFFSAVLGSLIESLKIPSFAAPDMVEPSARHPRRKEGHILNTRVYSDIQDRYHHLHGHECFLIFSAAEPLPNSAEWAMRLGILTASPTFQGIGAGNAFTACIYDDCASRSQGTKYDSLVTHGNTALIFICHLFWQLPGGLG